MKKTGFFEEELQAIKDDNIKLFTGLCLEAAPDYIFVDCPSSSTGKYHPEDELGSDGTVKHTKKVFNKAQELVELLDSFGFGCKNYRDHILSSCIIHDLRKQGIEKSGHTVKEHPALAAQLVEEIYNTHNDLISETTFSIIKNACGYHYGQWSVGSWKKDMADFSDIELIVHLADYIASRRNPEDKSIFAWLNNVGL